jgi:hypothetical protein
MKMILDDGINTGARYPTFPVVPPVVSGRCPVILASPSNEGAQISSEKDLKDNERALLDVGLFEPMHSKSAGHLRLDDGRFDPLPLPPLLPPQILNDLATAWQHHFLHRFESATAPSEPVDAFGIEFASSSSPSILQYTGGFAHHSAQLPVKVTAESDHSDRAMQDVSFASLAPDPHAGQGHEIDIASQSTLPFEEVLFPGAFESLERTYNFVTSSLPAFETAEGGPEARGPPHQHFSPIFSSE